MSTQNITSRDRFIRDMQIRNFSKKTIKSYVWGFEKLARFYERDPREISFDEVNRFQQHLIIEEKVSFSYYKVIVCGIRFFYRHTLHREGTVAYIPFPKSPRKLPLVLAQEEVRALFEVIDDLKYKTLLMALYSSGLRLFEACKLKVTDIDSKRMILCVYAGKGGKDRFVQLSTIFLEQLRVYYKANRKSIGKYLFSPRGRDTPLNENSVQRKMKAYCKKAGIKKRATPHTLRHSFATHSLENGENLLKIQQDLGHTCLQTTLIYLHCATNHISKGVSPLDVLYQDAKDFCFERRED